MRAIHLILAGSLAANLIVVVAYFQARRELAREEPVLTSAQVMQELALTPDQLDALRQLRRNLRLRLRPLREQWQPLFDKAVQAMRDARPGDTSFEEAFQATGEVRRRQTLEIARELIAYRETLTPAQREVFNRHIGEWPFIETLMGTRIEGTRTPPSGPFQSVPAPAPSAKSAP
ncbi:MAG: periplasmic heavy metal sensor [Opitutaceae bacterium]|nr:periplasmic heavy metal sensor [Opitutaceae bacterium]